MQRTLNIGLSPSQFDDVIKELKDYRDRILPMRIEEFTQRLTDRGIEIAKSYTGFVDDMGNASSLIEFRKDVSLIPYGCQSILVMEDRMPMSVSWLTYGDKVKTEQISPTLMYEFGSGKHAIDGHRGTFPRSDGKPSKGNKDVWSYKSLDGSWHSFSGITPTQPMYHAVNDLYSEIVKIAKEVF